MLMASKIKHHLTSQERSKLAICSILVFVVSAFIGHALFMIDSYMELQEDSEDLVIVIDDLHKQGLNFSEKLARLSYNQCNTEHLDYLMQLLKKQPLIMIIRYYGDEQKCSTQYLDKFPQPVNQLITGSGEIVSFYPAQHDELLYDSYAVRVGNYELVYSTSIASSFLSEAFLFEIIYRGKNEELHVAGTRGLFNANISTGLDWLLQAPKVAYYCSERSAVCIALKFPADLFVLESISFYIINFSVSALISLLTFLYLKQFFYNKRKVTTRIANGLMENNFYFLYQPLVRLSDQKIIGCEVLARFKDQYGDIYPDQFIPLLPSNNITWQFTENLIEAALSRFNSEPSITKDFRLSINIFPQDISNNNIGKIANMVAFKQADYQVMIEITEDQCLDEAYAQGNLYNLSQHGIGVAIDDFGTGYSNLQQIQNTYCNVLKIDRSFVIDLEDGAIRSSLIPNIVEIAKKAELQLLAEGIENQQQYLTLKDLGIEYGQGWLFGKPMPFEDFIQLMKR